MQSAKIITAFEATREDVGFWMRSRSTVLWKVVNSSTNAHPVDNHWFAICAMLRVYIMKMAPASSMLYLRRPFPYTETGDEWWHTIGYAKNKRVILTLTTHGTDGKAEQHGVYACDIVS